MATPLPVAGVFVGIVFALTVTVVLTVAEADSTTSPINDPVVDALNALYKSTGGPQWTTQTNWGTATSPCTWFGVCCLTIPTEIQRLADPRLSHQQSSSSSTQYSFPQLGNLTCEPTGTVLSLSLGSNNLVGPLPTDLTVYQALNTLIFFNAPGNAISGPIPTTISALTSLAVLDLSKNALTGPIPTALSAIQQQPFSLDLQGNVGLTGSISTANLPPLAAMLNFGGNTGIVGPLPGAYIRSNSYLLYLNIAGTGMREPAAPAPTPADLILSANLTHPYPVGLICPTASVLGAGSKFRIALGPDYYAYRGCQCDLGYLGSVPDKCVYQETAIRASLLQFYTDTRGATAWVDRTSWNASVTSTADPSIASPISVCRWAGVQCSPQSSTIPPQEATAVIGLTLFANELTGTLSPNSLAALTTLQTLSLSSNKLYGPLPPSFAALNALTLLDLSENAFIDGIPDLWGAAWTAPASLYLDRNALTIDLANTTLPANLRRLDLSDNVAVSGPIPFDWALKNANLRFLNLAATNCRAPPAPADPLHGLTLNATAPALEILDSSVVCVTPQLSAPLWPDVTLGLDPAYYGYLNCSCSEQYAGTVPSCAFAGLERAPLRDLYVGLGGATWTNRAGWNVAANDTSNYCLWYGVCCGLNRTASEWGQWIRAEIVRGLGYTTESSVSSESGSPDAIVQLWNRMNGLDSAGAEDSASDVKQFWTELEQVVEEQFGGPSNGVGTVSRRRFSLWNDVLQNLVFRFPESRRSTDSSSDSSSSSGNSLWWGSDLESLFSNHHLLNDDPDPPSPPATCNSTGVVVHLQLSSNNLVGVLPPSVAQLTFLVDLDLHDNQISGPIPDSLATLTHLFTLSLAANLFSGPIPALYNTTPGAPTNASSLSFVDLSGNPTLSGTVTNQFPASSIVYLDLSNNPELAGALPYAWVQSATGLLLLDVSGTGLHATAPSGVDPQLNFHHSNREHYVATHYSCPQVSITGDSTVLLILSPKYFNYVNCTCDFPYDGLVPGCVLTDQGVLTLVYLYTNGSKWIERAGWSALLNPELIGADGQPAPDQLLLSSAAERDSAFVVGSVKATRRLHMGSVNGVRTERSASLTGQDSTTESVASSVTRISAPVVSSLSSSSAWRYNPVLDELVPSLPVGTTAAAVNLCTLYGICCGNIDHFNMAANRTCDTAGPIVALDLFANNLRGPLPTELGTLTSMQSLFLSGNALLGPLPTELGNLAQLTSLLLSDNRITSTIPTQWGTLAQLTTLMLDNNNLQGTIPPTFANLKNLQRVYLDENSITGSLPTAVISAWTQLIDLSFSRNLLISTLPLELFTAFPKLELLNLRSNLIYGLFPVFQTPIAPANTALTYLYLSENGLSGELPSSLQQLTSLQLLDLDSNDFTGTFPAVFAQMPALRTLRMANNFLHGPIANPDRLPPSAQIVSLERNLFISGDLPYAWIAGDLGLQNLNLQNTSVVAAPGDANTNFVLDSAQMIAYPNGHFQCPTPVVKNAPGGFNLQVNPEFFGYVNCTCDFSYNGVAPNCVYHKHGGSNAGLAAGVTIAVLLMVGLGVVGFFYYRKRSGRDRFTVVEDSHAVKPAAGRRYGYSDFGSIAPIRSVDNGSIQGNEL